jgi:hypothetical protein
MKSFKALCFHFVFDLHIRIENSWNWSPKNKVLTRDLEICGWGDFEERNPNGVGAIDKSAFRDIITCPIVLNSLRIQIRRFFY